MGGLATGSWAGIGGGEEDTGQERETKWSQLTLSQYLFVLLFPDFAEKRLKLAEILYYKVLENVMVQEMKRLQGKDMSVSVITSIVYICYYELLMKSNSSNKYKTNTKVLT